MIRSVLRASTFSVLKLIESVTLLIYYTIPFGFSLFVTLGHHFQPLKLLSFWQRITDEGSVPQMRIWSILLIKSVYENGVNILVEVCFYIGSWGSLHWRLKSRSCVRIPLHDHGGLHACRKNRYNGGFGFSCWGWQASRKRLLSIHGIGRTRVVKHMNEI